MDGEEPLCIGHKALPTEHWGCPRAQVLRDLLALAVQAALLPPPPARKAVPAVRSSPASSRSLHNRRVDQEDAKRHTRPKPSLRQGHSQQRAYTPMRGYPCSRGWSGKA